MAAQSPPFALQNASHSAALFRQAVFSAFTEAGTLSAADLVVTAQSTPNMSVQVGAGRVWIAGTQVSNASGQSWSAQAGYFGINDAPLSVTITTANATNPRLDLIYVAVNDAFYSGALNSLVIGVATGTPAASPVYPALPNNALPLAGVAVAANATSIVSGNITATVGLPMVALGGINPVTATDAVAGLRTGQYRDVPVKGLQRWDSGASAWGSPTQQLPLCQVKQDTTQIIPLSTWTTVTFDNETVDTDGMHSNSTNNTRVTCTAAGYYTVSGSVPFLNPPGTSTVRVGSRLLKNGVAVDFGSAYVTVQAPLNGCAAETPTAIIQLAVGDYLELQAWQDFTSTGGGLNTRIASDQRAALSVACNRLT